MNVIDYLCNPIEIMKNVQSVSAGKEHCLVLKEDLKLMAWGESKSFRGGNKFIENPDVIRENFKGEFTCGPDFTVFHCEDKEI